MMALALLLGLNAAAAARPQYILFTDCAYAGGIPFAGNLSADAASLRVLPDAIEAPLKGGAPWRTASNLKSDDMTGPLKSDNSEDSAPTSLSAQRPAPMTYWATVPVQPNETMVIAGAGLVGASATWCPGDLGCTAGSLQIRANATAWDQSVQAVLPAECGPPCGLRLSTSTGSVIVAVNAPDIAWARGLLRHEQNITSHGPATHQQTRVLRVFGRGMAFGAGATTCISAAEPPAPNLDTTVEIGGQTLVSSSANCYEATFVLPATLVGGRYTVKLRTRWGASTISVDVPTLTTMPPVVIDVEADYAGNATAALAAAAGVAPPQRIVVRLGLKVYRMTSALIVPNRTAIIGGGARSSVLDFTLPELSSPLPPGRYSRGLAGSFAVGGGGSNWSLRNLSVVLRRAPAGSAAVWLDGCARLGTGAGSGLALLGVEVRLLQDNVTNNAVLLEGCAAPNGTGGGSGFEIGWSTFVQEGSCWFPSNGKRGEGDHSFGSNHKSVLTTVGASGGWVHHNHVLWNCGGWGSFVSSDRTVLEENVFQCSSATPAGHGTAIIEGGSDVNSWNFREHPSSKFWSVARNTFVRPQHNDDLDPNHQNWKGRETITTDAPGEFGHGILATANGSRVRVAWNTTNVVSRKNPNGNAPVPGAVIVVLTGPGLGQRREVVNVDSATQEILLADPLDAFAAPGVSYVAVVSNNRNIIIAGNSFYWGNVVQLYGNSFGGVLADNTLVSCNAKNMVQVLPDTTSLGALRVQGECYGGASPAFFTEILGNKLTNSDGIALNNPKANAARPGCAGYDDHSVSWLRWVVARRNTIAGISEAARNFSSTHPPCGYISVDERSRSGTATDVVVEHNAFVCPPGGMLPSNGVSLGPCAHCVAQG